MNHPSRELFLVGSSVVLGVVAIAFLRGTAPASYTAAPPVRPSTQPAASAVPEAPRWEDWRRWPRTAGLALDLEAAAFVGSGEVGAAVGKAEALERRAQNRAYEGAPPTVPHPVAGRDQATCAACHEEGRRLLGRQASPWPHAEMVSCLQCHALAEPNPPWGAQSPGLTPDPRAVLNAFVGRRAPLQGERWSAISPPVVPHALGLRERCLSCHGPQGERPFRSSHPERQNCLQCHATVFEPPPGSRAVDR